MMSGHDATATGRRGEKGQLPACGYLGPGQPVTSGGNFNLARFYSITQCGCSRLANDGGGTRLRVSQELALAAIRVTVVVGEASATRITESVDRFVPLVVYPVPNRPSLAL